MKTESGEKVIPYVANLLSDYEAKGTPQYFTIKVECYGNVTVCADREQGEKHFLNEINRCLLKQPNAIIVELFTAKGKNVQAHNSWRIPVTKSAESFSGVAESKVEVMKAEPHISLEKYMQDQLALKTRELDNAFDKRILQFDIEHKEKRIKELEEEAQEREAYIEQLEEEIEKEEKPNLGFKGIHLGELGTYVAESFLKRNPGLIKGLFELSNEQLRGIWQTSETEPQQEEPTSTATVKIKAPENLTEAQRQHLEVVEHISAFLKAMPSAELRKVYQILVAVENDKSLPDKLIQFINQLKQKTDAKIPD